jgi:hypothetical protein
MKSVRGKDYKNRGYTSPQPFLILENSKPERSVKKTLCDENCNLTFLLPVSVEAVKKNVGYPYLFHRLGNSNQNKRTAYEVYQFHVITSSSDQRRRTAGTKSGHPVARNPEICEGIGKTREQLGFLRNWRWDLYYPGLQGRRYKGL